MRNKKKIKAVTLTILIITERRQDVRVIQFLRKPEVSIQPWSLERSNYNGQDNKK
jgi:hypothetical protein